MLTSVQSDKDVVSVAFIHIEDVELYCRIWLFEGDDILKSLSNALVKDIFSHLSALETWISAWPLEAEDIVTSVVRPDKAVVPEIVIVLFVSLKVALLHYTWYIDLQSYMLYIQIFGHLEVLQLLHLINYVYL